MGIVDAILETGGCERFDGEVFSLFERRLRAEIGWYAGFGSSIEALIWDKDSDGRLSAMSGRSPPDQIADILARRYALGLRAAWTGSSYYAVGCCFPCRVIWHCAQFTFLNSNLSAVLFGIPILCGRTVARKQS